MIAASARMSGTTLPVSSNLKRGSMASRSAAACWAALVRATRARRLLAVGFFAVVAVVVFAVVPVVVVAFLTTGFFAVTVFLDEVVPTAALDCTGSATAVSTARKQISLAAAE